MSMQESNEGPRLGVPFARQKLKEAIAVVEGSLGPENESERMEAIKDLIETAHYHLARNKYKDVRGKRVSAPMTDAKVLEIAAMIHANPGISDKAIGDQCGVQGGRINEVRSGKHDGKLPPHLRFLGRRTDNHEKLF